MRIKNPIIRGFHPDPSIIRMGEDFYIITSSFEYFPSIPIWHSKDLSHWRQIGNVISSDTQLLDLSEVNSSGGVQAATIRYHRGVFYVTSTRIKQEWPRLDYHFIVTATDIFGPWSKAHFINNAEGIDSSLFFDGDTAYFLANKEKTNKRSDTDTEIWMQEIDLTTFTLIGKQHILWDGTGGIYPEGPRMFHRNGYYYLLIAEGGTLHNHTTTIARSKHLFGPYESSPRNPILTHKHISRTYPIQNVGHADMVELEDGSWVGVCLGSRPRGGFYDGGNVEYSFGGYYRNLGRETFLFPIEWPKDDWSPLFSPTSGCVEPVVELQGNHEVPLVDVALDFSRESLAMKWLSIKKDHHNHVVQHAGGIDLILQPTNEESFYGVRQTTWHGNYHVNVNVSQLAVHDVFVFAAWITKDAYLSIEIHDDVIQTCSCYQGQTQIVCEANRERNDYQLHLEIHDQAYGFGYNGTVMSVLDGRTISCDMNDAHTGVMIGFTGTSQTKSVVSLRDFTLLNHEDEQ